MTFGIEKKLKWFGHLTVKRIHERDRQTDAQTPHDGVGRACIASRGNDCRRLSSIIIIIIFISRKNKQKHCLHRQSDKKKQNGRLPEKLDAH